tara:strand:+ start:1925 stop:2797 length:873 start_codon:yes stop_codon:yes gene_type:complete
MSFIAYLIILSISFFLNLFPRFLSLFIGRKLGMFIYYLIPIRKKIALVNIKDNLPELNHKEQLSLLKNTYKHFGMILVDFLRTKKLNKKNINKLVSIDENTRKILNENPGSIIVTGHLGNWEYFLPILGLNDYNFSIVAQPIKNIYLNTYFLKIRTSKNVEIIFKNESTKKMLNALNNNYFLGLASDQNAGKKGTKVKFLNIEASIPKGAAIFHIKTKKPIILAYCIMDKNYNYEFKASLLDTSNVNLEREDAVSKINGIFTKNLGKMIKHNSHQYFWFHKMKKKSLYKK